jgi:hypothetical protein
LFCEVRTVDRFDTRFSNDDEFRVHFQLQFQR